MDEQVYESEIPADIDDISENTEKQFIESIEIDESLKEAQEIKSEEEDLQKFCVMDDSVMDIVKEEFLRESDEQQKQEQPSHLKDNGLGEKFLYSYDTSDEEFSGFEDESVNLIGLRNFEVYNHTNKRENQYQNNQKTNESLVQSIQGKNKNLKSECIKENMSNQKLNALDGLQQEIKAVNKKKSNLLFRKPLQMGWKRELVLRAAPTSSKDKGEAYYITPSGKKLRTKSEIMQHLTPGLSIDMFTFVREALGFEEEIIRSAKPTKTADSFIHKRSSLDNNLGKRVPKPKAPKGASPPPQGWTPTKAVKAVSVTSTHRPGHKDKSSDDLENKSKMISKVSKQSKKSNQLRKLSSEASLIKSTSTGKTFNQNSAENFFTNLSVGCQILTHIFQYLSPQELGTAACVCRSWNIIASHKWLWRSVRMKNLLVINWTNLITALIRNETKFLIVRKMLKNANYDEEMWSSFSKNIKRLTLLEGIDVEKCSTKIIERLFQSNTNLRSINAVPVLDGKISLKYINNLKNLEKFKVKPYEFMVLDGDLPSLQSLKNLKYLSLTSFSEFNVKQIHTLSELSNLETLELGHCTGLNKDFAYNVLAKLKMLKKLRLEKISEPLYIGDLLEVISKLDNLTHLELINFDIQNGFYEKMLKCKNLQKLLIIPTYIVQSATKNKTILKALKALSSTLNSVTWVFTTELMNVTKLYAQNDQSCKDPEVFNESIPIIKPLPDYFANYKNLGPTVVTKIGPPESQNEVEIVPTTILEKVFADTLLNTKINIVKVPLHSTWRQNLV